MNKNNKGRRNELTKLKLKKRCKNLRIGKLDYSFKRQGKPCSCFLCSPEKWSRKIKHKNKQSVD